MRLRRPWLFGMLVAVLVSCVTVNIYFPAAAIQKAADQIVDDVRSAPEQTPQRTPEQAPEEKKDKTSRLEPFRFIGLNTMDGSPERRHAYSFFVDAFDLHLGAPFVDNYGGYLSPAQLAAVS